jgi:hypothetical protein
MKNYSVFISEDLTTSLLTHVELVLAQPTCGKTTFANKATSGNFIIDSDDVLHLVKRCHNQSGWDVLNKICFDCNQKDDFTNFHNLNEKEDQETINLISDFVTIMKDVIKACIAMSTTADSSLIILTHHHSMFMWSYSALMSAKQEVISWNFDFKVSVFYRKSAECYITEWRKRQITDGAKNRSFTDADLAHVYNTWLDQVNMTEFGKIANIDVVNMKSQPLSIGEYLSDVYGFHEVDDADLWDMDCDVHRYQVLMIENLLLQLAFSNALNHDVDKYGYENLSNWKRDGFDRHRSADAPSHHHKENVEIITDLTEMVADWISASHRRMPKPWIDTIQGCSYGEVFDMNRLVYNTFIKYNTSNTWFYIWVISQLVYHRLFDKWYKDDEFTSSFPFSDLASMLKYRR